MSTRPPKFVTPDVYGGSTMSDWPDIPPDCGDSRSSPDVRYTGAGIISDRYLNQAIGACCTDSGRFLPSKSVKQLIARYAPADRPTMNAISQDHRRRFLSELAEITGRPLPPEEPIGDELTLAKQKPGPPLVSGKEPIGGDPASAHQDAKLIANGYEPIAVKGKVPMAKGWNTRLNTIDAAGAERACHPGATSTGLRTGRLVGVDIDIVPTKHVEAIKLLATQVLGYASLERVGAKGAMLCYRNETPISKITVSGKHPTKPGKIEILGTGQQFVGYGPHPDTGKSYTWTNALCAGEPLQTPFDELPELTPDGCRTSPTGLPS